MSFESKENQNVDEPTKYRKPVGNLEAMDWDKDALKAEVENFPDKAAINWSELARRHNVQNRSGELAKNGGQIAQEWLKSVGVNIDRFKRMPENCGTRFRRKKLRGAGGEITLATPQTNANLKNDLKNKILSDEYSVGELITPKNVS